MLLLPGEHGLTTSMVGLRIISRDAAMRAGRPYAIVGKTDGEAAATPLPWWAWVSVGGLVIGAAYLVLRRREGQRDPEATYVLTDRDVPASTQALLESRDVQLHPFSPDAELLAAFERDADSTMLSLWKAEGEQ